MTDELRLPDRREMPANRRTQRRAHLVRELRSSRKRRRLGRPLILIPAALALLASGAFAATQVFDDDQTADYLVVDCYQRPSLNAPSENAIADLIAPPGQQPGDRTPAEMCAELWETGELGSGRVVPGLASCLGHREVAVFPGGPRTCRTLGLRELPAAYQAGAARFTEFIERGAEVLAECTTVEELDSNLSALYAEFGREWEGGGDWRPLPGRDCVGGLPRPIGIEYMLTFGLGEPVAVELNTAAERRRERRQERRGRDERDYYIGLLLELRRQACEYEELVPEDARDECLARVQRQERRLPAAARPKE